MSATKQGQIWSSDRLTDSLVASLIKTYKDASSRTLGRTVLQKLCYFAKACGVPLPFRFEIYHYGPFSQEIFDRTENLLLYGIIEDKSSDPGQSNYVPGPNFQAFLSPLGDVLDEHSRTLQSVATMFSELDPGQMELVSTIHYMHSSHRDWFRRVPGKEAVVTSVLDVKGDKFSRSTVERAYDLLKGTGLLTG